MTATIGGVTDLPDPISRRDRQKQTREAVVFAARASFARDGYHGARLDEIARAAGFSKGAVYSNFSSKAELFLAVMDMNIEQSLASGLTGLFEPVPVDMSADDERGRMVWGLALATLEFVAAAARDEGLLAEVSRRVGLQIRGYGIAIEAMRSAWVERGGAVADDLSDERVGALLAALDQGAAALTIAGSGAFAPELLQEGVARLLRLEGVGAAEVADLQADAAGRPVVAERLAEVERDWREGVGSDDR